MAYGLKYFAEMIDRKGNSWNVKLYQDGWASGVSELRGGKPMLSLIYEGDEQNPFIQPILASRLELKLLVNDVDFENDIASMLSASESEWRVDINLVSGGADHLKWRGNIIVDTYQLQRCPYPYEVILIASDGIGRLRDIPFEDPAESSHQYVGRETQFAIIVKILNKLGHELQFVTADEWFETNMAQAQDDDPLAQTYVDQAIYWDSEKMQGWSCYDVLADIMIRKSLQLAQSIGAWFMTQLPECANATMIERRYNNDGTVYALPSIVVDRSVVIDETMTNFIEFGAIETAEKPIQSAGISYDHGVLESYLSNGGFEFWNPGVTDPLVWSIIDKGSGPWSRSADHYEGSYSFKISSDVDGPPYDPSAPRDPDDITRLEQQAIEPIILQPNQQSRLRLSFAHKYSLIGGADPLVQKEAFFALTCGDYAIQIKGDYSGFEWVQNSGAPIFFSYLPSQTWWGIFDSVPIDTPPTQDKIVAYFTTLIERIPFGSVRTVDWFWLDDIKLLPYSSTEGQVPTTERTIATLNAAISTYPLDLGVVYHGDGPALEAIARMTLASGDGTALWTYRAGSDDLPLASLQTSIIASYHWRACRIISGNILAQLSATSIPVIDGDRFILSSGTFNIDNVSCEGVWQEVKDDGESSTIVLTILQESEGTGGGGAGGMIVDAGSILARFTAEAATITARQNVMQSDGWDGVIDPVGSITTPGTIGWAIAGKDEAEFVVGTYDYLRAVGSSIEFGTSAELKINRAMNTDGLSITNPTAATVGVQAQHSPWLTLTCKAWDTVNLASGAVSWHIRAEGYPSPGPPGQIAPGGCLVFKTTGAQYIRRPFALDEQGRMLLAYGSGPFTVDGETIYGFSGEDFGVWPLILVSNIAGLNRAVVGWPQNNINSELYVTGDLYVGYTSGDPKWPSEPGGYANIGDAHITGTVYTTSLVNATNGIYLQALTPSVGTGQQYHSPWLVLECQAWKSDAPTSSEAVPWRIRSEGYWSPGHSGGCLVFGVQAQYNRRPFAIDEQGRMLLAHGTYHAAFDDEGNIYGFGGENFGDGVNWPLILSANIAGLNRVVIGWPEESIVSDLWVTGKIGVHMVNGEGLAVPATISSGSGAPGAAEADGSLYLRRDGAASTTAYLRVSAAWVPLLSGGGSASFASRVDITGITEQLRLCYDVSHYTSFTVASNGDLTLSGTTSKVILSGALDAGYGIHGADWPITAAKNNFYHNCAGLSITYSPNSETCVVYGYNYWPTPGNLIFVVAARPFPAGGDYSLAWDVTANHRMAINVGGNVMIGTLTSNAGLLEVFTTGIQFCASYDVSNRCTIQVASTGATAFVITSNNGAPTFTFNKSVSITGSGVTLTVSESAQFGGMIRSKGNTGYGSCTGIGVEFNWNGTTGSTSCCDRSAPYLAYPMDFYASYLIFYTGVHNYDGTEKMRLLAGGNFLIGTSASHAGLLEVLSTGVQFGLSYDANNRMTVQVASTGGTTFAIASNNGVPQFTFSRRVIVNSSGVSFSTNEAAEIGGMFRSKGNAGYGSCSGIGAEVNWNGTTGSYAVVDRTSPFNAYPMDFSASYMIWYTGVHSYDLTEKIRLIQGGNFLIGTNSSHAGLLEVFNTGIQLGLSYDASNRCTIQISSNGTTAFVITSSSGTPNFTFNKEVYQSGAADTYGMTIANPTASTLGAQYKDSPWLRIICHAWDTSGAKDDEVPWAIRNEGFGSPGHGGGVLVFKVESQYYRKPFAIDEQGRMLLAYGGEHIDYRNEGFPSGGHNYLYGFGGEDFGDWPIILSGDIAGLNRVVVGWPEQSIVSDLFVTGRVMVNMLNGEALTTPCTISSGNGAPAAAEPDGSIYLQRDAASGDPFLFVRESGVWVGK